MEKRDERKLDAAELERAEEAGRQLKKVEDIGEAMKSFCDGYQAAMETMQRILTAPRTTAGESGRSISADRSPARLTGRNASNGPRRN